MPKLSRWIRISLEIIGATAIIVGLGWLALWAIFRPFKNLAGGNCDDTEQQTLSTPNGSHTVKVFHRVCGAGAERPYSFYFVYLSTGNTNPGYEYTPILELKNIAPKQASVAWDGPDQLSVAYPASAEVVEAYAKILGVQVVLHPELSGTDSSVK